MVRGGRLRNVTRSAPVFESAPSAAKHSFGGRFRCDGKLPSGWISPVRSHGLPLLTGVIGKAEFCEVRTQNPAKPPLSDRGQSSIPPRRYQTLKPHMLWCCIKMRDIACGHCRFTTVDMMVLRILEMRGGGHRGTG